MANSRTFSDKSRSIYSGKGTPTDRMFRRSTSLFDGRKQITCLEPLYHMVFQRFIRLSKGIPYLFPTPLTSIQMFRYSFHLAKAHVSPMQYEPMSHVCRQSNKDVPKAIWKMNVVLWIQLSLEFERMHMKSSSVPLLSLIALAQRAFAWGELGHQTVGFVAMEFLAPNALSFVQSTLAQNFSGNLGPAAPWADSVREEKAFSWSAPFHFVDAEDDPEGGQCSVEETRDCGSDNCILTAIANYTVRVVDTSLSSEQRLEALLFLDHFFGDIGQPLHVEAFEVGGNDIDAICSGSKTNLHASWDTGMVEKNIDQNHGGTPQSYASDLIAEIQSGQFSSLTSDWLACSSTTEPVADSTTVESTLNSLAQRSSGSGTTVTPLACPLVWAQESNAFDCTVVFNFTTGQDLCDSDYFTNAVPVIDLQLAKQGFRLAAWLNVLFDGSTNL